MTPIFSTTIKANADLHSQDAVRAYIADLISENSVLEPFRYALTDVVNTVQDDEIECYAEADEDARGFVSRTDGTRVLWMPTISRAAVNSFQAGDWQWTDASGPEDAIRRYRDCEMAE